MFELTLFVVPACTLRGNAAPEFANFAGGWAESHWSHLERLPDPRLAQRTLDDLTERVLPRGWRRGLGNRFHETGERGGIVFRR